MQKTNSAARKPEEASTRNDAFEVERLDPKPLTFVRAICSALRSTRSTFSVSHAAALAFCATLPLRPVDVNPFKPSPLMLLRPILRFFAPVGLAVLMLFASTANAADTKPNSDRRVAVVVSTLNNPWFVVLAEPRATARRNLGTTPSSSTRRTTRQRSRSISTT
jgi:hypothetical protein